MKNEEYKCELCNFMNLNISRIINLQMNYSEIEK